MDHSTEIAELLTKKLSGETSEIEEQTIAQWLQASAENEAYFHSLKQVWERLEPSPPSNVELARTEKALNQIKGKIRRNAMRSVKRTWPAWAGALAASVALLLMAIGYFQRNTNDAEIILASNESPLTQALSDGSEITLNQHTNLTLLTGFNEKERRTRLKGEAYFKIAPDATRPFVVEVDDLEVKVVGTAFNVDAVSAPGKIRISVMEGKVQLRHGQQTLFLSAEEEAIFDKKMGKIIQQTSQTPNVLAYQNRRFVFDETPLSQVIQQLNGVYGVKITLANPKIQNCPLSARFDDLPLNSVLALIVETFSLQIDSSTQTLRIIGDSCGE